MINYNLKSRHIIFCNYIFNYIIISRKVLRNNLIFFYMTSKYWDEKIDGYRNKFKLSYIIE